MVENPDNTWDYDLFQQQLFSLLSSLSVVLHPRYENPNRHASTVVKEVDTLRCICENDRTITSNDISELLAACQRYRSTVNKLMYAVRNYISLRQNKNCDLWMGDVIINVIGKFIHSVHFTPPEDTKFHIFMMVMRILADLRGRKYHLLPYEHTTSTTPTYHIVVEAALKVAVQSPIKEKIAFAESQIKWFLYMKFGYSGCVFSMCLFRE